ncbi:kinase-like domain-containing protein [Mariannaea sp. PMI_226]|nr:kinase-like domain-containing protein [Mariannaea sp. PMI_226]
MGIIHQPKTSELAIQRAPHAVARLVLHRPSFIIYGPIGTLFPLRLRLWLGKLLFRPLGPSTVRVSRHRVIKGPCDPPEVEAMQYVVSHTSIPVPKIYAVHTEETGSIYIEMAYVKGECLDSAWSRLSKHQRDTIFADIKQHLSCLRDLQPPTQAIVSSALLNPAYDCRIGARFFGPMNHSEFHSLARGHLRMEDVGPFLGQEVVNVHTARYQTHFTHADFAPRNIIVRHGRVAAIIDWAFAGWYPEYWEFTKSHYNYFQAKTGRITFVLPSPATRQSSRQNRSSGGDYQSRVHVLFRTATELVANARARTPRQPGWIKGQVAS